MKHGLTIGIAGVLASILSGLLGGYVQTACVVWAEPLLGEYFPLAVGNRWLYHARQGEATEEWKVIRQEKDAFVVKITADSLSTASFEEFFIPTAAGVERVSTANGKQGEVKHPVVNSKYQAPLAQTPSTEASQPLFVLKRSLQIGTVWENRDGRYEVTSLSETVTVPAGTFENCVEVMQWSTGGGVTVITHYAPGVGVVQRDETFPLLEGSGNLNPRQKQHLVLQLKEWDVK